MQLRKHTLGITTEKRSECRDFYAAHLGFETIFENDWYIHMGRPGTDLEISFLAPLHPTQPPVFQSEFRGAGMWLALEVENVDTEFARLKGKGVPIHLDLQDEAWGERHFVVIDPSGLAINILTMGKGSTEYEAGYKLKEHAAG